MKNYPGSNKQYNHSEPLLKAGKTNTGNENYTRNDTSGMHVTIKIKPLWKIPLRYTMDDNGGSYEGL
jgi:hypothetical protein